MRYFGLIAVIIMLVFILGFHIVYDSLDMWAIPEGRLRFGLTIIPKEHLTFADTFVSRDTLLLRYNGGQAVNLYLIRKLQEKTLLTTPGQTGASWTPVHWGPYARVPGYSSAFPRWASYRTGANGQQPICPWQ